jgi:23S rRNA pseudouridine1911/1915/1917 synthase
MRTTTKSPPLAKEARHGAPKNGAPKSGAISLSRNFLHAARLELVHPRTGEKLTFTSTLPEELQAFLAVIERAVATNVSTRGD